jgi:hypothetical protein
MSEEKIAEFNFGAKCDQALADVMVIVDSFPDQQDGFAVLLGAIVTVCKRQGWGRGQTSFVTAEALAGMWSSFEITKRGGRLDS